MARIARLSFVFLSVCFFTLPTVMAAPPIEPVANALDGANPQVDEWDQDDQDFAAQLKETMGRYRLDRMEGRHARRVAIEALILATATNNTSVVARVKADLLQYFPNSAEAAFVLNSFPDVNKLREFLNNEFLKQLSDRAKAARAIRVVRLAFSRFQKELLQDQGFALRSCRAAFMADDRALCEECRKVLTDKNKNLVNVACDDQAPPQQRFQELQKLMRDEDFEGIHTDIREFQQHLLTLMTDDQRNEPAIRRILAHNLIVAGELDAALAEFQLLRDEIDDPEFLFQYGACLARLRRSTEARSVLKRIVASHADSPWKPSAQSVLELIDRLDQTIDSHAEVLTNIIHTYRNLEVELCDLEFRLTKSRGSVITTTVGMDFLQHTLEIVASKDEVPMFGFSSSPNESTVYLKGEPAILRLPKMPLLPNLLLSNTRIDATGFHGNTDFTTSNSLKGLSDSIRDLAQNDQLTSRAAMSMVISAMIRLGHFPTPVKTTNENQVLTFVHPDVEIPQIMTSSFIVDKNGQLTSAKVESRKHTLEIRRLILARAQDHHLTAGNWPALPTRVLPDNDLGTMMRLAGTAFQLVMGEVKTPETAEKDDTAPVLK